MKLLAKKSVAIASAFGVAGISSLFFGAAPASADPTCANGGTLISGNICELTLAANGSSSFAKTADMTQLQVLLVGGGGDGGYSSGGGGGQVEVVDFNGTQAETITATVGGTDGASSVGDDSQTVSAAPGTDAQGNFTTDTTTPGSSGVSGTGHKGYPVGKTTGGGGGGASASPKSRDNGGAGLAASKAPSVYVNGETASPLLHLFANDTTCYGGGGAIGTGKKGHDGTASCGGGSVATGGAINAPTESRGGGAGAIVTNPTDEGINSGASGVVVIRWNATPQVKLFFDDGVRGHAPATQNLLSGNLPKKPANPKVSHYTFKGWYTDAAFTTKASFTAPVTTTETFYGKFAKK
jgi:uncharacterized repeat protein (TIGR02543 family)